MDAYTLIDFTKKNLMPIPHAWLHIWDNDLTFWFRPCSEYHPDVTWDPEGLATLKMRPDCLNFHAVPKAKENQEETKEEEDKKKSSLVYFRWDYAMKYQNTVKN